MPMAAKALIRQLLACLVAVLAAHALSYFLMRALPSAATVALGLQSTNAEVVAAFESSVPQRSYLQTVADLARFELGRSLDGSPVNAELAQALLNSLPILLVSLLCAALLGLVFALWPRANLFAPPAYFLVFLPPFLFAFLSGGVPLFSDTLPMPILTILACAALPCCLLATQAHSAMKQELAAPYADTLRMYCATDFALRLKMLPGVLVKLTPSLETAVSLVLSSMLFAEPISGQAGLGTLTARAVRRSDLDLLLGAVLLCALLIAMARLVGWAVRRHYRVPQ